MRHRDCAVCMFHKSCARSPHPTAATLLPFCSTVVCETARRARMARGGCPARPASTRAASNAEQLDGRFLPYNLTPPAPMMSEQTHCFRCWVLPDACLESLPVPPNSSSVYNDGRSNSMGVGLYGKKRRPFKIHVAGLKPEELSEKLERMGAFVKDPLFSQILRHIERDVFPYDRDGSLGNAKKAWPPFPLATQPGDDELVMVWSYWEKGYGDVIANTLLPFGELLRAGAMPRHVALAGMRHATLLPPLYATTASLCASERPNPPMLPRCPSSCWRRIKICAPEFFESTKDSWRDTAALDAAAREVFGDADAVSSLNEATARMLRDPTAAVAAGYAAARLASADDVQAGRPPKHAEGTVPAYRTLSVLLAARHGRRLLANVEELAKACDGDVLTAGTGKQPIKLRCTVLPASAPQTEKIAALRLADVYISVWGGDTVHALHMRHGSAVFELRNAGFARIAPWNWLELHRRWVTRFDGGPSAVPPLHFYPIMVPANASLLSASDRLCFARNTQKQDRWRREHEQLPPNATAKQRNRRMPDDSWLCYWNANFRVEFSQLRPTLVEFARHWKHRVNSGAPARARKTHRRPMLSASR